MRLANYLNQDSPTIFTDEPIYFTRIAEAEVVLLLIYAKSKTDNIAGAKLKEIRCVIEN